MTEALVWSAVLTYNNFADTDECISTLLAQTYKHHRVVVIDNGSGDGSLEALQEKWGDSVEWECLPENLGSAAGWNRGFDRGLRAGADYVVLFNNDIAADPRLIERLTQAAASGPEVGCLSPVVTHYAAPEKVWYAGGAYSGLLGITHHWRLNRRVSSRERSGRLVWTDYVPTCAAMFSRRAVEAVGVFDEALFFGQEDVDWSLRARKLAVREAVLMEPLVRHKISSTGGRRGSTVMTDFSAYHFARGAMIVGRKHHLGPRFAAFLLGQLAIRLPYYSLQMLISRAPGSVPQYVRGLIAGATWRPPAAGQEAAPPGGPRAP